MNNIINIGIAEDHLLVRKGLIASLAQHKGINVLFEVSDGKELLEVLKTTKPDILLLDIEMPIMRAQDVLKKISSKYPRIKVIIISAFFQKDYIIECFKLGVKAFLPKVDESDRVLEAINSVYKNGIFSDMAVTKILVEEIQRSNYKNNTHKTNLSDTELEVLILICKGTPRKKAAEILGVKPETVNFHMGNIMRKTNTNNSSALVNYAIQHQLINPS